MTRERINPWMISTVVFLVASIGMASFIATRKPTAATSATHEVPRCDKYIERGEWKLDQYGPVLEITPTPCAREAQGREMDHTIAELVKNFGGNRNFRNVQGVINQFECHNILYKDKPTWDFEPDRPYVGLVETVKAQCNPSKWPPDLPYF